MTHEEAQSILTGGAEAVELLGYVDPAKQEALLGAIAAMPVAQRVAAVKKITQRQSAGGANLTSRDEAVIRISMLPEHLQKGLANKRLQFSDHILYWVKSADSVAAGSTTRLIANSDVKEVGVTNVQAGQLEQDQHFLLTAIRLTSGTNAIPKATAFGIAEAGVRNGDFEAKVNGKYLLPKDTSANIFDTTNVSNTLLGYYRLSNPKWLEPKTDLTFDLRNAADMAKSANIKLEFIGISVQPF